MTGPITTESASEPPETQTGTAELAGYGHMTWDAFRGLLGDAQAAWASYDGFHIGSAPAEPPPYSHLWAWTSQWLIRARIDRGQVIAGALILASRPAVTEPALAERVSYQRVTALTWAPGEERVGPMKASVAGRQVDLYLVSGERPVTFVAVRSPS
jgi:hypothetical protein